MQSHLIKRILMLLELAVGDAYGAGFEYASPDVIRRQNTLAGYIQHPRHRGTRPGMYTDDTQMSLAVAEALVSGERWTPENLAEHFVRAFHRDPREGYAGGFHAFLKTVRDGHDFLARIRPDSDKSGAAMRAAPLGVLPSAGTVLDRCRVQAALTHDTPWGIQAAQASSLMSHYFLYRLGSKARLGEFLRGMVSGPWSDPWAGKVGSKGWMSVQAAVTAVMRNDRLSDLLRDCIAFSGDVDTVATIALAAASCSDEYEQDLPNNLVNTLENDAYGRDYIVELDRQLLQLAGRC
jgi:ADP-ribosyl-[dinitrogen reductase] hydrolase